MQLPIFCLHCGRDFEITVEKSKITYPKKCPGCGRAQRLNRDQRELARDLEKLLTENGARSLLADYAQGEFK